MAQEPAESSTATVKVETGRGSARQAAQLAGTDARTEMQMLQVLSEPALRSSHSSMYVTLSVAQHVEVSAQDGVAQQAWDWQPCCVVHARIEQLKHLF